MTAASETAPTGDFTDFGAGATIGPSMVFGCIAARHAAALAPRHASAASASY